MMFDRPSGKLIVRLDVRDAPNVAADAERLLRLTLREKEDAKASIPLEAVTEHTTVPRLEDVERNRDARKEDERERKDRKCAGSHTSRCSGCSRYVKGPRGPRGANRCILEDPEDPEDPQTTTRTASGNHLYSSGAGIA